MCLYISCHCVHLIFDIRLLLRFQTYVMIHNGPIVRDLKNLLTGQEVSYCLLRIGDCLTTFNISVLNHLSLTSCEEGKGKHG